MKVKSLLVFASAAALPFASAFAQNNAEPGGPQGTQWYGYDAPSAAVLDRNNDGVISADEHAMRDLPVERRAPAYGTPSAGGTLSPQYDRSQERAMTRGERRRFVYQGHSADTNPPAPPQ